MSNWLEFYQRIPFYINPEIFRIGFFSIGWYAVSYIAAFFVVYGLLKKRLHLGEERDLFQGARNSNSYSHYPTNAPDPRLPARNATHSIASGRGDNNTKKQKLIFDFLLFCFLGLIIGARLGYVFFYNFSFYLIHPLAIISPFDFSTGELIGIYGMSYHGGLIGALIAGIFFVKKYKFNFWKMTDFIIPVIPAGYFFGRIGNFLNGELYGRATEKWWGMYFPADNFGLLRHPSQLYEAFLEGFLLFIFLWSVRNKKMFQNKFLALYLIGYALMRFIGEFYRQPDEQIGFLFGDLTLGQLFSLLMLLFGFALFFWKKNRNVIQ